MVPSAKWVDQFKRFRACSLSSLTGKIF